MNLPIDKEKAKKIVENAHKNRLKVFPLNSRLKFHLEEEEGLVVRFYTLKTYYTYAINPKKIESLVYYLSEVLEFLHKEARKKKAIRSINGTN